MYISAAYIDIKLNQDYADFFNDSDDDGPMGLIICDGIGEFKDSGIVAKTVAELFIDKRMLDIKKIVHSNELLTLQKSEIKGGTTLISAVTDSKTNKVKIQYLGNGGVIHFRGDYNKNANSTIPYRYSDIMMPHVAPDGSLTKHISNHSGKKELKATEIDLTLNTEVGDILLFFSDGIGSLENNVIVNDDEERYWRYENNNIQIILKELEIFFEHVDFENDLNEQLAIFNKSVLKKLKSNNNLEDDASLGIIISDQVFTHYKTKGND